MAQIEDDIHTHCKGLRGERNFAHLARYEGVFYCLNIDKCYDESCPLNVKPNL